MPTVLGQFAQHMQLDPPQGKRSSLISGENRLSGPSFQDLMGMRYFFAVLGDDAADGVLDVELEGFVGIRCDAQGLAGVSRGRLPEPDLLDECSVLNQPQQRGARGNQLPAGLLLGQTVEAADQHLAMLVDEDLHLLIVFGE